MSEIVNCKRCNRVFRKAYSPLCPECFEITQQSFSKLYRYVQQNPNQTLDEIAEGCGIAIKDAESILFDAGMGLGTAAASILVKCHICDTPVPSSRLKGRLCGQCANKVEEARAVFQSEEDEITKLREAYLSGAGGSSLRKPKKKKLSEIAASESDDDDSLEEVLELVENSGDMSIRESSQENGPQFDFKRNLG